MPRVRKFRKGAEIRDPIVVVSTILSGNYIFWRDKPMHPGWMSSLRLVTIAQAARHGLLYEAIENKEQS